MTTLVETTLAYEGTRVGWAAPARRGLGGVVRRPAHRRWRGRREPGARPVVGARRLGLVERDHPPRPGPGLGRLRPVRHRARRSSRAQRLLPLGAPLGQPVAHPPRRLLGVRDRRADRPRARDVAAVRAASPNRSSASCAACRRSATSACSSSGSASTTRPRSGCCSSPPSRRSRSSVACRRRDGPHRADQRRPGARRLAARSCCATRCCPSVLPDLITGLRVRGRLRLDDDRRRRDVERHPRHRWPRLGDQEGAPQRRRDPVRDRDRRSPPWCSTRCCALAERRLVPWKGRA